MCFSQYAQYTPRPVNESAVETPVQRPSDAPPTKAEMDENLFGPIPTPPEWQVAPPSENDQNQAADVTNIPGAAVFTNAGNGCGNAVTSVKTQTVEAVVVELANGTKLLICPL